MAKRKSTPNTAANDPSNLFAPIGEPDPALAPTTEDQLKELREQVGSLSKQLEAAGSREDRLQTMFMQLAANGGRQPQNGNDTGAPAASNIDFSKLPDPEKDPAGYRTALQEQINKAIEGQVSAQVQPIISANDRAKKIEGLWSKFEEKYEDLADFKDIAEAVAGRVLRESGVKSPAEADAFMFTDQDAFLDKVAKNMRGRIAQIKGGEDEENDETQPEPDRTIGIQGAAAQAGGGRAPANAGNSTMLSELKEMQKGIYY